MNETCIEENATNSSSNETFVCGYDVCVQVTIYRKVMGTIIFFVVWPFIVLDLKWFPLGRPAAAITGAALMVIFSIIPPDQVYAVIGSKGSLQAVCLILGMMLLSYYYEREGLLQIIALFIFGKNKPFRHILWKVCVLTACMASIITNDATSLVVTPLILNEHMKQGRSRKELTPLLIGIAVCANVGSAATFFGNPQNAYIASQTTGLSLLIFFQTTLPAAAFGVLIVIGMLYLIYCRILFRNVSEDDDDDTEASNTSEPLQNEASRGRVTTSFCKEHEAMGEAPNASAMVNSANHDSSAITTVHMEESKQNNSTDVALTSSKQTVSLRNRSWRSLLFLSWLLFITVMVVVLLIIPPRPIVNADFNLGLVPLGAGILSMVVDTVLNRNYSYTAIKKIDWGVVLMYMGLFTWLQGFDNTGFPGQLFDIIRKYMNLKKVEGVLFFTVFVIIGSNLLCNVPMTILVVRQIEMFFCSSDPDCLMYCGDRLVGLLLSWVATISGTFTLLGSVTNLIVAEKAHSIANYKLTFFRYLKFGFVSATVVLFSGLPIVYFLATVARG